MGTNPLSRVRKCFHEKCLWDQLIIPATFPIDHTQVNWFWGLHHQNGWCICIRWLDLLVIVQINELKIQVTNGYHLHSPIAFTTKDVGVFESCFLAVFTHQSSISPGVNEGKCPQQIGADRLYVHASCLLGALVNWADNMVFGMLRAVMSAWRSSLRCLSKHPSSSQRNFIRSVVARCDLFRQAKQTQTSAVNFKRSSAGPRELPSVG